MPISHESPSSSSGKDYRRPLDSAIGFLGQKLIEHFYHNTKQQGVENRSELFQIIINNYFNLLQEGLVLVFNHLSYVDQALITAGVYNGFAQELAARGWGGGSNHLSDWVSVAWPMNSEFVASPDKHFPVSAMVRDLSARNNIRVIPLNTRNTDTGEARQLIRIADSVLEQGGLFIMAPEGTRSRSGQLNEIKKYAGRLAMNAKWLVPVGLIDTELILHPSNKIWQAQLGRSATINWGKPIPLDPSNSDSQQMARLMQSSLEALLPEKYLPES